MTADEVLHERAELLNRLPFVRWDRCVDWGDGLVVYGWISRPDGRADFVLFAFLWPDTPAEAHVWSSSAERTEEITRLLYGSEGTHTPCIRVADVFGRLVKRQT